MDIGKKLRELRKQNDLTLEDLASRSELTKGFLSQVERNLTAPSIATLEDILEALGSNLSEFFHEEEEKQIVFGTDDFFVDEKEDYQVEWIIPNAQKNQMEPILMTLYPHKKSHIQTSYTGEEFGYVLKGNITIMRGGKKYKVKAHETFIWMVRRVIIFIITGIARQRYCGSRHRQSFKNKPEGTVKKPENPSPWKGEPWKRKN